MQEVYMVDAVRTPVGKKNGSLKGVRADDLLIHSLKALTNRNPNLDPNLIDDVIIGCAMPEGQQGINVARIAALLAGLPDSVSAYTLNRFCASGIQSIANAAAMIRAGMADVIVAGGVESMTHIPMMGFTPAMNMKIFEDEKYGIAFGMGLTAEKVAEKYAVSKERQNEFAYHSHQKALKAQADNVFADEIAPIEVVTKAFNHKTQTIEKETTVVNKDEGPRADTSIEALNRLKPVFNAKGSVTAGNSSQMSDGAASVLLVSEKMLTAHNLTPVAKFVDYNVAGVPPEVMGIGPAEAIPKTLKMAGLQLSDMGWIELNEAFAAQSLAVMDNLSMNPDVVNPLGGAIAMGHPLGATGAIRAATLLSAFKRDKTLKYGMITMCIGSGMGACGIFENVS